MVIESLPDRDYCVVAVIASATVNNMAHSRRLEQQKSHRPLCWGSSRFRAWGLCGRSLRVYISLQEAKPKWIVVTTSGIPGILETLYRVLRIAEARGCRLMEVNPQKLETGLRTISAGMQIPCT